MRGLGLQGTWVVTKRELLTHLKSPRLLIMGSLFALLVVGGSYGISGGFSGGGGSAAIQRQTFFHMVNASEGPTAVAFTSDLYGAPLSDQRFDLLEREYVSPVTPPTDTLVETKRTDSEGFARFGPLNLSLLQNGSYFLQGMVLAAGDWRPYEGYGLYPPFPLNLSVQMGLASQEIGMAGSGDDLFVHALDIGGNPIQSAEVYVNGTLAGTTDARGLFVHTDLPVPDDPRVFVLVNVTVVHGQDSYETQVSPSNVVQGGLVVQSPDTVVLFLSSFVGFLAPIFAIVVAFDSVVKERVHGTMDLLLSRPVSREGVALGKFLGSLTAVSVPAVTVNALGLAIVANAFGRAPTATLALAFLLGVVLLAALFILLQQTLSTLAKAASTAVLYGVLLWLAFTILFQIVLFVIMLAAGIDPFFSPEGQRFSMYASFANPVGVFQLVVLGSASDVAQSSAFFTGAFAVPLWSPYVAAAAWFLATFFLALFTFRKKAVE